MNPRTWNVKWVAAFAAAVVIGAIGVIVVLSVMGRGDGQATAEEEATAVPTAKDSETTPASTPGTILTDQPTKAPAQRFTVHVPSLPSGFAPPAKRDCSEGWRRMSDVVANYSFCLPPGWAILDPNSSEPSDRTTMQFESAAILSPEGFPYPYAGSYEKGVRDLVRDSEKNLVWMQVFFIPEDSDQPMSCDAKASDALGGLPSARCQNKFTIPKDSDQAVPDPAGQWQRLFVVLPLPNAEAPPDWQMSPYATPDKGYSFGLGILFEGRVDALAYQSSAIDQILGSLEGQP